MGTKIETKKGFVDHYIDLSIESDSFLPKINALVDWKPFENYLKKNIKRGPAAAAGQPSYPDLVMLKALLLQSWYKLSDEGVSFAMKDRISFIHFIGLPFESSKPDGSTVCRFRNRLLEGGHAVHLLEMLNRQLLKHGLLIKSGVAVDATLVESSRRPRKTVEMEIRKGEEGEDIAVCKEDEETGGVKVRYSADEEAAWTVKGKKAVYGYKVHLSTDLEQGFILGGHVTGANIADTTEMEKVLEESALPSGATVEADKGYTSQTNRDYLEKAGYEDRIMRRGRRNKPLTDEDRRWNAEISKTRWIVERSFGTLKKVQGFVRLKYLGLAKANLEFTLQALAHNIRKAVNLAF